MNSNQFQYVTGQIRESFADLMTSFAERSTQALALPYWELDVPYGPHAREVMDVHKVGTEAIGTVVYFHAGYWQSRDKSQFRFLAPAFNAMGWDIALVNYPLCPEVSVASIMSSAALALQQVAVHQRVGERKGPIVLCGHSAGAHLAVELALKQFTVSPALPIAGVIAISGLYDLEPLLDTTLNTHLKLDADSAKACSPTYRVRSGAVPALFVWGNNETLAFHDQSQEMARLWQVQGNMAKSAAVPHADHFSVLDRIISHDGLIMHQLQDWANA